MTDSILIPRELLESLFKGTATQSTLAFNNLLDLLAQPASEPKPVAWRVTGNRGLTVTSEYPEWATGEGSQGLKVEALVVAHPAPAGVVPAAGQWREGAPPHPWDSEWFLAKMSQGQFVVLRPLPEEYTYDFTTADGTYVMRKSIVKWAQLSGSEYVEPEACREETARLNGVQP